MGIRVASLAFADPRFEILQLLEAPGHPRAGTPVAVEGARRSWTLESKLNPEADVLVDFTKPEGFRSRLLECVQAKTAFVSGTTGLSNDDRDLLVDASSVIPVLHAPNMSLGVEVLCRLAAWANERLGREFDVEVVEAHHGAKADAPSGTALRIVEALTGGEREEKHRTVFGRQGRTGPRRQEEVGIHAVRGGDMVGEHTVHFLGPGERLELIHRCTDRGVFARGALRAASVIAGGKPGMYGPGELLSGGGEISH